MPLLDEFALCFVFILFCVNDPIFQADECENKWGDFHCENNFKDKCGRSGVQESCAKMCQLCTGKYNYRCAMTSRCLGFNVP